MRYRELFTIGWGLTWREAAWCTAVGVPALMALGLLFDALGLQQATNPAVFMAAFGLTILIIALFLLMPRVIRSVVSAPYQGFHLSVRRTSGVDSPIPTYREALQVAMVVGAISAVETILSLLVPDRSVAGICGFGMMLMITNPLVAALMLKIPYRGFRLQIVHE